MSKDHLEVLSANHAAQVDRVNEYHGACLKSYQDQMGYAFLCGVELSQLKERIPHGQFDAFRKRYFPDIPERSAQRYLAFSDALRSKSATVADLANKPLQLTDGRLPEAQQTEVLKAVHDYADGKTITALYRDLGVIRPPQKQKHHPVKLTPEDRLQADLKHAADLFHDARGAIDLLFEDESIFAKVPSVDRLELLGAALRLTKKLRTYKKDTSHKSHKSHKSHQKRST